ncbi:MAG: hypothetical protein FJ057_10200 [Cyanobacteria bacterium K_DeepCast_0m_m1_088]|nr:hypothetical protein [Cyanobacteria bacterium K_DeepCast_0m_m1_088]
MANPLLTVVTVQTGHRYPDLWVSRLAAMVARHLLEAHRFIIYTDRPEPGRFSAPSAAHQQLEVRDLEGGALRGFFGKLRLFDQGLTGSDPFLFLDSTLVIRASLAPLIAIARSSSASVIGVRDWNYPILNSSVLWCRPDAYTQTVWDAWHQGRYADVAFPGDQNVIFHVFNEQAPAALTYWPEGLVSSYKVLRKLARRDPEAAQHELEANCILKFHGRPKPEEVLHPWRHPRATILRHPLQPRLWSYLADDIRAHWR